MGTRTQPGTARVSYLEAIVEAQIEEMERDPRVILLGEDLTIYGDGKVVKRFGADRVINTPISENSFCGLAVGAAMTGLRPVVALNIASFMYLAADQIINQAGKLRYMSGGQLHVPAVFRCTMYYGSGIAAQHSDRPYPMFMNSPGLKILAPASPSDAKGLLKAAIRGEDPVVVFEDSTLWTQKGDVSRDPDKLVPLGKAAVRRSGSDVTVVAIAGAVGIALEAATQLESDGVSVEVVDPRSLVPLDEETILESVEKTGRLVIVDNANRTCGAAAEIAARVADKGFSSLIAPIRRVTTPDVHVPFSPALEKAIFPGTATVIAAIRSLGQRGSVNA
jgi:acetoin:2,6-dichlorophenolindophenol oxidoreductase subunit beta